MSHPLRTASRCDVSEPARSSRPSPERPAPERPSPERMLGGRPLGGRVEDFRSDETAAPIPCLMSHRGFELALTHCLDLLDGAEVSLTVFAVGLRGSSPPPPLTERVIVDALAPLGSVGRLPDGRIALMYMGPHGAVRNGRATGDALSTCVLNRILSRLRERGLTYGAASLELRAVHCRTDQGATPRGLLSALSAPAYGAADRSGGVYTARGITAVT